MKETAFAIKKFLFLKPYPMNSINEKRIAGHNPNFKFSQRLALTGLKSATNLLKPDKLKAK